MAVMGQESQYLKSDSVSKSISIKNYTGYNLIQMPDTFRVALMIANKRASGRPRICIGKAIQNKDYTNTFFDHRNKLIDRKRVLWACVLPTP